MKRHLKIPDSLDIYGQTIETEYSKEQLYESGDESDGLAYFNRNKIYIWNPDDRPQSTIDMIYFHELTHFMVYYASNDKAPTYKEPFIQGTSVLLHQFLTTAEYRNDTMIIPNKFKCGAIEIKTQWKKEVVNQNGDAAFASSDLYSNRIHLCLPDDEFCMQRIEVAFCLQLLVYFSYVLHDGMTQNNKNAIMYTNWPYILHQVLKQFTPTK